MTRQVLVGLAGLLLLGGCSGTPFGDQLSRSFSSPPAANQTGPKATDPNTNLLDTPTGQDPAKSPDRANPADPSKLPNPAGLKPKAPEAQTLPAPATSARVTLAPAPYRVTIKLPSADPSAPAEAVTKALRAAGVSFEVETIERVRNGSQGQSASPSVTPAPQLR